LCEPGVDNVCAVYSTGWDVVTESQVCGVSFRIVSESHPASVGIVVGC